MKKAGQAGPALFVVQPDKPLPRRVADAIFAGGFGFIHGFFSAGRKFLRVIGVLPYGS